MRDKNLIKQFLCSILFLKVKLVMKTILIIKRFSYLG